MTRRTTPLETNHALDRESVRRLLSGFDGQTVTLWSRTRLDDPVVDEVRHWLSEAAGRELEIDAMVNPTQDAGAIVYVGDEARIVLDQRAMWLADVQRAVRDECSSGTIEGVDAAFATMSDLLGASHPEPGIEELVDTGTVLRVGDGVAVCTGLRDVESQELVEFEGDVLGIAFSLKDDSVGCLLLGPEQSVHEGGTVRRTRQSLRVPVGDGLLGRVVDAVGRPIDDRGSIVPSAMMETERMAPGVVDRRPVDTPLHTGWKVLDALVPIGMGQRELIIGDRKIGKTTLAVDAILAQAHTGVACVYCAIGQKSSSVKHVVELLAEHDALSYTTVVAALPADPPAFRYVAPYAACAMGEYYRDRGRNALVVFDDLTKHAMAYREMSALLDRPVGREAYPGDIFYIHSRLLERASCLADSRGGGTLTALPIAETLAGDISAFIPTNVISICDGQIVLEAGAFNEGRRPAMDAGLSVSRVGGAAQTPIMKRVAGRLRIDIAQFEEMAQFVKFGAEVDATTAQQLARGERARGLLTQDQHQPMPLCEQVLVLDAAVIGVFDQTPITELEDAENRLLEWARSHEAELLDEIENATILTPELESSLARALAEFSAHYNAEPVAIGEGR